MVKDLNDPTNVDTIPAMLTAGEYVLNKEATAMFGPMIEKMNQAGLHQRKAENQMVKANTGMMIPAGGGYNTGGLVNFLKEKEGYRDDAYQDDAGVWTIGYGRTTNPDGSPIRPNQTTDQKKEDAWLQTRAASELEAVKGFAATHGYDLSEGQLNALASFRYNGGQGMLDMLTDNGQRDLATIEQKFPQYNKVTDPNTGKKVFVQGLQNRRDAEMQLWKGATPSEVKEVPQELPAPPTQAINEAVSQVVQPEPPQQEVSAPADGGFPQLAVDALQFGAGGPEMLPVMAPQLQQVNPEYIPSVTEDSNPRNRNDFGFNGGGQVLNLRNGGRADITPEERERRRLARLAAANNTSKGRNVARQGPLVTPTAPQQPAAGLSGRNLGRAGVSKSDPFVQQVPNMVDVGFVPPPESVPSIDNTPPVPGSDEAILQGSSQQVEQKEEWTSMVDPADLAAAGFSADGSAATSGSGAIDSGIIGPDSAPSQAYKDAQIQGGFTSPEAIQAAEADIAPTGPQLDSGIPRKEAIANAPAAAAEDKPLVDTSAPTSEQKKQAKVASTANAVTQAENEPPAPVQNGNEIVAKGKTAPPEVSRRAKNAISNAFGDLFDRGELMRMMVVYAGAMMTGASPGRSLAIAGQMYLSRIDAKTNQFNTLATSGKYSPQSLKTYRESGDPTDLVPLGTAPEATGNFKTLYGPGGKKVVVQEMKVGKNTILVDQSGKQVNGYALQEDPVNVRGTPEWRTRIKTSSGQIKDQLTEMRKTFDTFQTDQGEGSKTDILPSTSAAKIAEWAADNGVEPDQLGGLVESAYHDALNDRRQDGARARDLVPYLQQLVIRQQVGGNADVFKAKDQPKDGPPQYVNPSKLKVLNSSVASLLQNQMGKQGTVSDLSNLFYTEALKDWNDLPDQIKNDWNRKALKDESGFFKFAENMVLQGSL